MLTRRQVERLAARDGVSLFVRERDYVQAAFLGRLCASTAGLVLKGGTCIRLVHGSPRYSEDLDFGSRLGAEDAWRAVEEAVRELGRLGIEAVLRDRRGSATGFGAAISYRGPLFDGRDGTKGRVRVDVSLRGEGLEDERVAVRTDYDDVRTFVAVCATPAHLLAEKVRALLVRGKARDLFDVWFLLGRGVTPDRALIDRKLCLYGRWYSPEEAAARVAGLEKDWERDLGPLLGSAPPFAAVAREVLDGMLAQAGPGG
jgi:predicted nucleotidyltransferase component of viral defense system